MLLVDPSERPPGPPVTLKRSPLPKSRPQKSGRVSRTQLAIYFAGDQFFFFKASAERASRRRETKSGCGPPGCSVKPGPPFCAGDSLGEDERENENEGCAWADS